MLVFFSFCSYNFLPNGWVVMSQRLPIGPDFIQNGCFYGSHGVFDFRLNFLSFHQRANQFNKDQFCTRQYGVQLSNYLEIKNRNSQTPTSTNSHLKVKKTGKKLIFKKEVFKYLFEDKVSKGVQLWN